MDKYTASDDEVRLQSWHRNTEHLHHTGWLPKSKGAHSDPGVTTGSRVSLTANSRIKNYERHRKAIMAETDTVYGGIVPRRYRSFFR